MRALIVFCGIVGVAAACTAHDDVVSASDLFVDSVPILDIKGDAPHGSLLFASAAAGTILSSGFIVVADRLARRVRFFDASGAAAGSVGGDGEGPGEFRDISWMGQCGADSVFVWDATLNRVTIINDAGEIASAYRISADQGGTPPTAMNCSRNGVMALLGSPRHLGPLRRNGEWIHYKAPLSLADTRGRILHEIGEVAAFEGRPLGKQTLLAVSADHLFVGTMDSAFIDVYGLDGEQLTALPVGVRVRAATMRHYERAVDAKASRLDAASDRQMLREMMLGWEMPERLPPYTALFTDSEQRLWVQVSVPGDPETWLRAFGDNGRSIADIRIPLVPLPPPGWSSRAPTGNW